MVSLMERYQVVLYLLAPGGGGFPASALMPLAVLTQTLVEHLALTLLVALYRTQKIPATTDRNGDRAHGASV